MQIENLSNEIVKICRDLRKQKLVNATHGNISARYQDIMLITPTGCDFNSVESKDIVQMDINTGKVISLGKPSKEYDLHLSAYRKRPDIKAVVHAHSPNAVAISCINPKDIDDVVPAYTLSFALFTKRLPMIGYFKAGSPELAENASNKLIDHNAVLLQHHGVITVSDTLMKALYRVEEIEENCSIALHIGLNANCLNPDKL